MSDSIFRDKKATLYFILSAIFITNAIIAEFGGVKIFSAEAIAGIRPVYILGFKLDFNLSVGVLIWPLVFIFSDIMNEYFGRQGVKRISLVTAIMITWSFLVILVWTKMPPSAFWLDLNSTDPQGRPFDINFAYSTIFRQGLGIIAGSVTAFLVSQLVDAVTFQYLKKLTGHRKLWLRATGSTVVSQLIDSFVILTIAFYFLGNWSFSQVMKVGIVQYTYKVLLAIVLTPLIYLVHVIIDRYLGHKQADAMIDGSMDGAVEEPVKD